MKDDKIIITKEQLISIFKFYDAIKLTEEYKEKEYDCLGTYFFDIIKKYQEKCNE